MSSLHKRLQIVELELEGGDEEEQEYALTDEDRAWIDDFLDRRIDGYWPTVDDVKKWVEINDRTVPKMFPF